MAVNVQRTGIRTSHLHDAPAVCISSRQQGRRMVVTAGSSFQDVRRWNLPMKILHSSCNLGHRCLTRVAAPEREDTSVAQQHVPQLADLELHPFINNQGMVLPPEYKLQDGSNPPGFVFAVYDSQQKLQYLGFSRDLRNSLRTLLGRRPEKAFFYKAHPVPVLDQDVMISVREAWYEQVGGAPSGNKLQLERNMWQQPVDGGAISARGKLAAAEDQARKILEQLTTRGLKEAFIPNPALLENGQVDFLPSSDMSEEDRAALIAAQAAAAADTRMAHTVIDGQERPFHVRYTNFLSTKKGGYMVDCVVSIDNRETKHRVIVGTQYIAGVGLEDPEPAIEAAFSVLLGNKIVRHTEGIMAVGQFPVNYFTVSEVEQWFGEQFQEAFKISSGMELDRKLGGIGVAWRFTRLHSYGSRFIEEQDKRAAALGQDSVGIRTSSFVFE